MRTFKRGDRARCRFTWRAASATTVTPADRTSARRSGSGAHQNGGFGEYVLAPRADVNAAKLPDAVDMVSAAGLGCRDMTAYHGVVDLADVRPGEWVAVFGIGGVGLAAVQIASALGGRVIALSCDPEKLVQARAEGAEITVTAGETAAEQSRAEQGNHRRRRQRGGRRLRGIEDDPSGALVAP